MFLIDIFLFMSIDFWFLIEGVNNKIILFDDKMIWIGYGNINIYIWVVLVSYRKYIFFSENFGNCMFMLFWELNSLILLYLNIECSYIIFVIS